MMSHRPTHPPQAAPLLTVKQTPLATEVDDATGAVPRSVAFPYLYILLVVVSTLDLLLTYVILLLGGFEVNPVANAVLMAGNIQGMVAFKFSIVALVIVICEVVNHHAQPTARRLAIWAVLVSAFPVVWSSLLLHSHFS